MIAVESKALIREALIQKIYQKFETKPIVNQLIRCVRAIAICDYPKRWPGLLDQIYEALTTQDEKAVQVGLMVMLAVT